MWREGAVTTDEESEVKKSAWRGLEEFDLSTLDGDKGSGGRPQRGHRV